VTKQLPLEFPTVTAPRWEDSPVAWACWYLRENGHVYKKFRELIDDALRANPTMRVSADQALHVLRWNLRIRAEGDVFAINDHASALFARLYIEERPHAKDNFELRKSFFDMLNEHEKERLMRAFEPLRINKRRFV
jgi:hypothetical protein